MKNKMVELDDDMDIENVGIMQGFKDMLQEDDEDEDEYEDESDAAEMMDRRPDSPEIIMNNLRGDMRSVDARREELADLVGYPAAAETPNEVLALLQPVLATQAGIGALPGAQDVMAGLPGGAPQMPPGMPPAGGMPPMPPGGMPPPPAGGMPPMPPPGMPPMPPEAAGGMPPIGMARGGYVQRFNEGSDEDGVTPIDGSSSPFSYPPELVQRAQLEMSNMMARKPLPVPSLESAAAERAQSYKNILGDMTGPTQAQMLFELGQRAFNYAANVDESGRPLRGSAAARLAGAVRTLPGAIGKYTADLDKQERAIKLAGIQAAEKDIQSIRDQNAKTIETQRKTFAEIVKSSGGSLFGKGDWEWNVINRPGLLARWSEGKTSEDQDNLVQSAITALSSDKFETRQDPVTKQPYTITVPAKLPKFVSDAIAARNTLFGTPGQVAEAPPAIPASQTGAAPATGQGRRPTTQPITPPGPAETPSSQPAPAPVSYSASDPTLFNMAGKGTGIVNVPLAFLERVPLVGEFISADDRVQANTFIKNAVNQINRSVATNPRFAEGERQQIQAELGLFPSLIDREEAYQNRLIGLDTLMLEIRKKAYDRGYNNPNLKPEDVAAGREKVQEIDSIRQMLGVPPRVQSKADFEALPPGAPYVLNGTLRVKER